jgi:VWFA-related protein
MPKVNRNEEAVMSRTIAVALLLVTAALPLPTSGQTPGISQRIDVTLVEVPVTVVDKSGAAVRDLKAENFEVFDGGQKRTITNFEMIDHTVPAATTAITSAPPSAASRRNFLLLFDLNGSSPGTLERARQAARKFVGDVNVSGDRVGVASFAVENGFRLLTSFTTDKTLLSRAIEALGTTKNYQPVDPLLLTAIQMREEADEMKGSKNAALMADEKKEVARLMDKAVNDMQRQFIRRTLIGYTGLAHTLDRIPGRKQVIILSEGFDPKLLQGRQALSTKEEKDENQLIEQGQSWRVDTDNRYGNSATSSDLQKMIETCRRSDVVLHAIDIKGLRTSVDASEGLRQTSSDALMLLTHDTGGQVFKNVNNLDEDFRRLLRSQEVVYTLGFKAPETSPGTFHDLKVKLVGVPGARPYARAGYFEPTGDSTPLDRTLSAGEIIMNQVPVSQLGVETLANPFPRKDGPLQVPVVVEVNGRSLLQAAGNKAIRTDIFIYAFDEREVVRDFVHQQMTLDPEKLKGQLEGKDLRFYDTLMVPPGDYSIRTLVSAGPQPSYGFHATPLHVPGPGEPVLLGATAFDDHPEKWVMVKAADRPGGAVDYPYLIGGTMLVPDVLPVLHAGTRARVGVFVNQILAGTSGVTARLQGPAGNASEVSLHRTGGGQSATGDSNLLFDFTPPVLPAGRYQLVMHVGEDAAAMVVSIPFVIE